MDAHISPKDRVKVQILLGVLITNFNQDKQMTETRTRWTKEEDKILVKAVKANPHNKAQAFRYAATKLENRDAKSCSNRWYMQLSNPESKHYVGCMFTMIGHATKMDNRTINRKYVHITPEPIKEGLWSKIKKLLGL